MIDETHQPGLLSWVESAQGHRDFPIQNLPFAVFTSPERSNPRGGVAIGDRVLDLSVALQAGLLAGDMAAAAAEPSLNHLMTLEGAGRRSLRRELQGLLSYNSPLMSRAKALGCRLLPESAKCQFELPATIGDYTDFYAGINHAKNIGSLLRPENPLLPNYKHVPVGYHGRASSVRVTGEQVHRPSGQTRSGAASEPNFGPTRRLDIELEIGMWIGPGNLLGKPIPITQAAEHIFGFCLLNDWSARDIQSWEYQPLGPFLGKSFLTTISPWVVTPEALAPFRIPQRVRPDEDPRPLPYLWWEDDQQTGAIDMELEVFLSTSSMRRRGLSQYRISLSNAKHLYWTPAQLVAHHTSNGCNLRPGDLIGSGTISATSREGLGSLMEMTRGGAEPLALPGGECRSFLEDGDEITIQANLQRDGCVSIGFGQCYSRVAE